MSRLTYYNVPSCSLSEWKQAQCRDGDGCGDPCEQAIATSKQAEEVIKLICHGFYVMCEWMAYVFTHAGSYVSNNQHHT